MKVLELEGAARAMGEQHGEAEKTAILGLYEARMTNCIAQAAIYGGRTVDEAWVLEAAERCLPFVESFAPAGLAELEGVARGSGLKLRQIWAMNALTDLRDVAAFTGPEALEIASADGEGCSSIVAAGAASRESATLAGQTWDLSTDNLPYVRVVHRKPEGAPETVALTTVGCLSLIGMSAAGLAVGTTNLRTTDARHGVGYLDVIHEALRQESFAEARRVILDARRAGAHYFYLTSADGEAAVFEGSATRLVETPVSGWTVHCNHALDPENVALECPGMPVASSHHRQARLTELAEAAAPLGPEDLKRFFADQDGGPNAINRKDYGGISSNGSVVLALGDALRFWAVHGPADEGTWIERTLPRQTAR